MTPVKPFLLDGKRITVYGTCESAPAVYVNMYEDTGNQVITECEKIGCRPFNLVSVSGLNWNGELSPWPTDPASSMDGGFTGGAGTYARWLTEALIPCAEGIVGPPSRRIIAGYSMAGLFALYAPYVTGLFDGAVSASGSLWYPGFVEYAAAHEFIKAPKAVYLSLGDRESHTKSSIFSQTESCTRQMLEYYSSRSIASIFELNPGNHFRDAALRLAKGIVWILDTLEF